MSATNTGGKIFYVVLIVFATIGVLALSGKLNIGSNNADMADTDDTVEETASLHGELVFVSGDVYKKDGKEFFAVETGEILSEGEHVKTGSDATATILLDDGSIVRLDGDTEIEIKKIQTDKIIIHEVVGEIYNRVAKADGREYLVYANDVEVTALGTAFLVSVDEEKVSVSVIESKVSVHLGDEKQELSQGEKVVIHTETKEMSEEKIHTADFVKNEFVAWNKQEDEKEQYDLGILKEVSVEEEETKDIDETVSFPAPVVQKNFLQLAVHGSTATWTVNGTSLKGFKLVWSKNPSPTYPTRSGDKYAYYSDANTTSGGLKGFDGAGTYYVRVCEYLGGKCGRYSNQVSTYLEGKTVVKPVEKETVSNAVTSIKMSATGKQVNWTVDGTSAKGFKVVWSKNTAPTYPTRSGDKYIYLSNANATAANIHAFDGSGAYYVRVCEYLGGACGKYSNQIMVELEK
jgi:hypothetical protein